MVLAFPVLRDWDFPVDQRAYVDASLGRKSMLWEKLVNRG